MRGEAMGVDSCDTMRIKLALCHTVADVTDVMMHPPTRDAVEHMWQRMWRVGRNHRALMSRWAERYGDIGYDLAFVSYGAHW